MALLFEGRGNWFPFGNRRERRVDIENDLGRTWRIGSSLCRGAQLIREQTKQHRNYGDDGNCVHLSSGGPLFEPSNSSKPFKAFSKGSATLIST